MADKQDTQGLFISFKEIFNKVQEDINLGIEIIRLRNQYNGFSKTIHSLYTDLGQKVFELYKEKKDPMPAIREMYEEMQSLEKSMDEMKKKISALEAKASAKTGTPKNSPASSEENEKEQEKPSSGKTQSGKTAKKG